ECEAGSLGVCTSAVALGGGLDDRKPKSGPGTAVRTPETPEGKPCLLRAQAGAFVGDGDPATAVAARVLEQIREYTFERAAVAAHARRSDVEVDVRCLRRTRELVQSHDLVWRCGSFLARKREQVACESCQPPGVLLELCDEFGARAVACEVVDVAGERGQRRAQLVRSIGEEAPLCVARALERAQ